MEFRRLFDLLSYQQISFPNKSALNEKGPIYWKAYATSSCITLINEVSAGLLNLGLKAGDKIAVSVNYGTANWCFLEMGALQIGLILVPIAPNTNKSDWAFILKHAEVKYSFVGNREMYEKVKMLSKELTQHQDIYVLNELPDVKKLSDIFRTPTSRHLERIQTYKAAIHDEDIALLVYEAAIEGNLKGAMLSHKNLIFNIKAFLEEVTIAPGKTAMHFGSPCQLANRLFFYAYLGAGAAVYFVEPKKSVRIKINELKPTVWGTTPEELEKLMEEVLIPKIKKRRWNRNLKVWALRFGKRFKGRAKMTPLYWVQLFLADLLVYRSCRRKLGGKLEAILIGGKTIREEYRRLLFAWGIPVFDGFGLLETAGLISLQSAHSHDEALGTLGQVLEGLELFYDEHNELSTLMIKGPNVMTGYYKDEKANERVFSEDGFLITGCKGKLIEDQYLLLD